MQTHPKKMTPMPRTQVTCNGTLPLSGAMGALGWKPRRCLGKTKIAVFLFFPATTPASAKGSSLFLGRIRKIRPDSTKKSNQSPKTQPPQSHKALRSSRIQSDLFAPTSWLLWLAISQARRWSGHMQLPSDWWFGALLGPGVASSNLGKVKTHQLKPPIEGFLN